MSTKKRARPCDSEQGSDAFLVQLGRSIADALRTVSETAESSRSRLRETRLLLVAAVNARCDELERGIDSAESKSTKVAALERELVAVDELLEHSRAKSRAESTAILDTALDFGRVVVSLPDHWGEHPITVIEPPYVGLFVNEQMSLAAISCLGHVVAPLPVNPTDLTLEGVSSRVYADDHMHFDMPLGSRHASQSVEELEVSLGLVAGVIQVNACFEQTGAESQALQASVSVDAPRRRITVILPAPVLSPYASGLSTRSYVHVSSIDIAGQAVVGPPLRVPVYRGIRAPAKISMIGTYELTSPCISPEGVMFVPLADGPEVSVFDEKGGQLQGISVPGLGNTCWSALASGQYDTSLLLADQGSSARLVSVDPCTISVRWTTNPGAVARCGGIAALPSQGVVVASALDESYAGSLSVYRLSDGVRVATLKDATQHSFLAADTATGILFGGSDLYAVHAWACTDNGLSLKAEGPVAAAGQGRACRPLAVVPPAPGSKVSHLVVGVAGKSELLVLSLPGLALVHTHDLEGVRVMGLTADPWGAALAVCDGRPARARSRVVVLAWPLPGMPQLE